MARRVDQVELVRLAVVGGVVHAHRLAFDGDATLTLDVHAIEQLVFHIALGDRARHLQDAVGQGRFAMVDMRDDREVPDMGGIVRCFLCVVCHNLSSIWCNAANVGASFGANATRSSVPRVLIQPILAYGGAGWTAGRMLRLSFTWRPFEFVWRACGLSAILSACVQRYACAAPRRRRSADVAAEGLKRVVGRLKGRRAEKS